jgi:hypothetical protein
LLTTLLTATLFLAFALLAFAFLAFTFLFLSVPRLAALAGSGGLLRFVRVALCFHDTFRCSSYTDWPNRISRLDLVSFEIVSTGSVGLEILLVANPSQRKGAVNDTA